MSILFGKKCTIGGVFVSVAGSSEGEHCVCKEEVEVEEAKALVAAMEKSQLEQTTLPYVPGLSQNNDATMTIRVQDETVSHHS